MIPEAPAISIVIPCYNGMSTIARCLDSVCRASQGQNAEIILVDSSADGTDRFVAARYPEVRMQHLEEKTLPGKARNLGVRLARAGLIAFVDADCMVPPQWLDGIFASFQRHPEQAAMVGGVRNGNPGPASWVSFISEFNGFFGRQKRRPIPNLPTYCAVYRREVFERYQGFPEDLWPGEDILLSARLAEGREPIFLEPEVWVYHNNRETWAGYYAHQYRIGYGFSASRLRLPRLPGGRALRKSPAFLYPMAAYRAFKMLQRTFRSGWGYGFRILGRMPQYLRGASQWVQGARQGYQDHRDR